MPWFKVDDQIVGNKKFARIPRSDRMAATGLWTTLGSWCARELTGGHVERHMVAEVGGTTKQAGLLIAAGLWEEAENGYQFVNWDQYQPTREQVESERDAAKERQRRARERARTAREARESPDHHGVTNGVTPLVVTVPPTRPVPVVPTELQPPPSEVGATSAEPTAQDLVAEWIDHCSARPPSRVIGHVAKELAAMLAEGIPYADVRAGLASWQGKGLHPSTLASEVHACRTPRRPTPAPAQNSNLANIARWAEWANEEPTDEQKAIAR